MASDDHEIDIINARKLRELREKAAAMEKAKANQQHSPTRPRSPREILSGYLYDRADEVLDLAYKQYPAQTQTIVTRIAELVLAGEIPSRISGGELLMLFRSVGIKIRLNTTIKVEDNGKFVSFSEKLKNQQNDSL